MKVLKKYLTRYFIDAMGAMALGLFASLLIGTILKTLGQHQKPIILYNINGFWDNMISVIGTDMIKGFISPEAANCFCICETPESVFRAIEAATEKH